MTTKATSGALVLFDVRVNPRATKSETKWFHTQVAKILYLLKLKPECLTAFSFLLIRE